jgi:hypothetical protein
MKKGLIALATTVALVAPASAGSPVIPAEYRGEWCLMNDRPFHTPKRLITKQAAELGCGKGGGGWITITENEYVATNASCRLVKILLALGRGYHVMQFQCEYLEETSTDSLSFVITGSSGSRSIPNARLYIEDANDSSFLSSDDKKRVQAMERKR